MKEQFPCYSLLIRQVVCSNLAPELRIPDLDSLMTSISEKALTYVGISSMGISPIAFRSVCSCESKENASWLARRGKKVQRFHKHYNQLNI